MISATKTFFNQPKFANVLHWGKLISLTGLAQLIVQVVGFACGILIIRLLPIKEYALYTLVNTMLGTITVLADGGISNGVMAAGGKVWNDKFKLGAVLATGLDLRRKFAIGSLLFSLPILFYLLYHNGASLITSILITVSMIPAFFAALSDSLLEIVPKLHQRILPLQKNQMAVSIFRLLLSTLFLFVFPWAFVAILAAGIPRIWGNFKLKKIVYQLADENQQTDKLIQKDILALVKKTLPGAIYYCFSGQLSIWIISFFGNTNSVAQLGALGRLNMLLAIFNTIVATLIVPRFAKLSSNKKVLLSKFFQIIGLLVFVVIIIIGLVHFFPKPILWLLGNTYSDLHEALLLSVIGSCISLLAGIAFSLYSSRGWAIHPAVLIMINVSSIIAFSFVFNLSTLSGVLWLNICMNSAAFIQTIVFSGYKILKLT
jgi:O-antigen/teichoic acid export membrane protein